MSVVITASCSLERPRSLVTAHLPLDNSAFADRRRKRDHVYEQPDVSASSLRQDARESGDVLFKATLRGRDIAVGHATCGEVASLVGTFTRTRVRDVLELWSLLAIRDPDGCGTRIVALGWRVHLMRAWLTPPLVALDPGSGMARASTGQVYRLMEPDDERLEPRLRLHLVRELGRREFAHVRN